MGNPYLDDSRRMSSYVDRRLREGADPFSVLNEIRKDKAHRDLQAETASGFAGVLVPHVPPGVGEGWVPASEGILNFLKKTFPDAEARAERYSVAERPRDGWSPHSDVRIFPESVPELVQNRPSSVERGHTILVPERGYVEHIPEVYEGADISRNIIRPKDVGSFPEVPTEGRMYRGMSAEELENASADGFFKSIGSYNLPGQEGLTYWSSKPKQAQTYANDFAPWAFKATPSRPAYVVEAVHDPSRLARVDGVTELGMSGATPLSDMRRAWRGDVYAFEPANYSVFDDFGTTRWGGTSPTSRVTWSEIPLSEIVGK